MEDVSPELIEEMRIDWNSANPDRNKYMREVQRKRIEEKFGVSYPTWWLCDICSKPISGNKILRDLIGL